MSFLKEFKEFAFKGNVLDMAIGVVIGNAFSKIVTSLVNDIIMQIAGVITSGSDFTSIVIPLKGESAIMIGNFIQSLVDFLIIAVSIFIFVKLIGKFKRKEEEPKAEEPEKPTTEELLTEIRDLLKKEEVKEEV